MTLNRTLSFRSLIVSLLLASLVVAGCSPASSARPLSNSGGLGKIVPSLLATAQSITNSLKQAQAPAVTPDQEVEGFTLDKAQSMDGLTITPTGVERHPMHTASGEPTQDTVLTINVSIENTSETDTITFRPDALILTDLSGHTYDAMTLTSLPDHLTWHVMKPSDKVEGFIAFRVPNKVSDLTLEFSGENGHHLDWRFKG